MHYSKAITIFLTCFLMQPVFAGNPVVFGAKLLGKFAINNPFLIYRMNSKDGRVQQVEQIIADMNLDQLRARRIEEQRRRNIQINHNMRLIERCLSAFVCGVRGASVLEFMFYDYVWRSIKNDFNNWHTVIAASPDVAYKKQLQLAGQLLIKKVISCPVREIIPCLNSGLRKKLFIPSIIFSFFTPIKYKKKLFSVIGNYDELSLKKQLKSAQSKEKQKISIKEKITNIVKTVGCMVLADSTFYLGRGSMYVDCFFNSNNLWQKARKRIAQQELLEALINPNGEPSAFYNAVRSRVNHQQRLPILFALAWYRLSKRKYKKAVADLDQELARFDLYKKLPDEETCSICYSEDRNAKILPAACTISTCSENGSICLVCFEKIMRLGKCPYCRNRVSWGIVTQLLVAKKPATQEAENGV